MFKIKNQPCKIKWAPDVEEQTYPVAESYLLLLYNQSQVSEIISKIKSAPIVHLKAKDILQTSGLTQLGASNIHLTNTRIKIQKSLPLSPILLVYDERNGKVIIVDGYHRLYAIHEFYENIWIKCKVCRLYATKHEKGNRYKVFRQRENGVQL